MYCTFQLVKNKGANQAAWMRRLGCAFDVRNQQSHVFSRRGLMLHVIMRKPEIS